MAPSYDINLLSQKGYTTTSMKLIFNTSFSYMRERRMDVFYDRHPETFHLSRTKEDVNSQVFHTSIIELSYRFYEYHLVQVFSFLQS